MRGVKCASMARRSPSSMPAIRKVIRVANVTHSSPNFNLTERPIGSLLLQICVLATFNIEQATPRAAALDHKLHFGQRGGDSHNVVNEANGGNCRVLDPHTFALCSSPARKGLEKDVH